MKIITLEMQGFGPFKSTQTIDFSRFSGDGLFLIEGDTGAGKSSILDAITWALYSVTARWIDSKANDEFKSVRSHFCGADDVTRVQLIFEVTVGNRVHTYRIERSILGLKKDGSEKAAVVHLFEILIDGSEVGVASTKSTVSSEISKLVKLDDKEFLQVALLAQGRFQAFLEATSDERLKLLSKLFDTGRFAKIQTALNAEASDIEGKIRHSKQGLEAEISILAQTFDLDLPLAADETAWLEALRDKVKNAQEIAKGEVAEAKRKSEAASEKERQAHEQIELGNLEEKKRVLERELESHNANKDKLELAQKAEKVAGLWDSLKVSENELEAADSRLKEVQLDKKISRDLAMLKAQINEQSSLVEKLKPLIDEEESINVSRDSLDNLTIELGDLTQSLSEVEGEVEVLRNERASIEEVIFDVPALKAAEAAAKSRLEKFLDFKKLEKEYLEAKQSLSDAEEALRLAIEAQRTLTDDYGRNFAATIASKLKTGQACLVCGSTNHPAKATAAGEIVTDKQINAANAARSAADTSFGSAKADFVRLKGDLERLSQEFKNLNEESLSAAFADAEKASQDGSIKQARLEEIQNALDSEGKLQKRVSDLRPKISSKKAEIQAAITQLTRASEKVAENLMGFKSIKVHHQSAILFLGDMNKTLDALEAVSNAADSRERASKQFEAKLKAQGFKNRDAFEKAYLDEGKIEELEVVVQNYINEMNRLETLLAGERFKALPEKTIDALLAKTESQQAKDELTLATQELGSIHNQLQMVIDAEGRIAKIMPDIKKYSDDYETHMGLANIVNGKAPNTLQITLESYFAAAELEVVLEAANSHLKTMSAGSQYTLLHSDKALRASGKAGLGIVLLDEYTGRERQPETLSGGEKFQASLAIALGLAQVVSDRSGAIRVDTLFIDEGFGSLSSEVLDTAMRTLDSLKQGGRTIGLISHVERMKEEISAKLHVAKTPRGPSVILQDL